MAQTELIIVNTLDKGVNKFLVLTGNVRTPGSLIHNSWASAGLALLNFSANGSPNNPVIPPVLTGLLRGSGSVFIGNKLLQTLPEINGQGAPNTSHSEEAGVVTVGYNVSYATRMHEELTPKGDLQLGAKSKDSANVQGGWLRSHLETDGGLLMKVYASLMNKGLK